MENRLSATDEKLLETFKNNVLDKFPDAISRKLPQGELYSVYTNDNPLKGERLSVNPFEGKTATSELQAWKEASEKVMGQSVSQNNDLNNNGIPDRKEKDLNNNGIEDRFERNISASDLTNYLKVVKPNDGGLDALTNMLDFELYSKINWNAPKETPKSVINELVEAINSNKELISENINRKTPLEHINNALNAKPSFTLESIPFSDLQKLGISRTDILKNTEDLNKLLAGERTNSIPISKFDALDVKVQLELVRNNSNEVKLVVTPNQMEMKTEHQKNVDSLLKIDGVIKDSTSKIENLISNHSTDFDLVNEKTVQNNLKLLDKLYPGNNSVKELTPDTWLQVDSKLADQYNNKFNLPVAKVNDEHHIGFILKDIDKHSLKQNQDVLQETSTAIFAEKSKSAGLSR